jgi:hypothetical protein
VNENPEASTYMENSSRIADPIFRGVHCGLSICMYEDVECGKPNAINHPKKSPEMGPINHPQW